MSFIESMKRLWHGSSYQRDTERRDVPRLDDQWEMFWQRTLSSDRRGTYNANDYRNERRRDK